MRETYERFVSRVVKAAERKLGIPRGWWGRDVRDVWGPHGQRVRWSGRVWTVSLAGKRVATFKAREKAIKKAVQLRENYIFLGVAR